MLEYDALEKSRVNDAVKRLSDIKDAVGAEVVIETPTPQELDAEAQNNHRKGRR